MKHSTFRFNVDCDAPVGLYGGAVAAFGVSVSEEVCPALRPGAECNGAVSNCWSPGQKDTGEKVMKYCM